MKELKDFVPYDESYLLNKLGFNEPCLAFYEEEKNKLVTFHSDSYQEVKGNTCLFKQVNAPTFSQAFRWFREKYSLSGNIDCCDQLCEWNIKSSKLDKSVLSCKIQSYEDAEIACLRRLLEIVKIKYDDKQQS